MITVRVDLTTNLRSVFAQQCAESVADFLVDVLRLHRRRIAAPIVKSLKAVFSMPSVRSLQWDVFGLCDASEGPTPHRAC